MFISIKSLNLRYEYVDYLVIGSKLRIAADYQGEGLMYFCVNDVDCCRSRVFGEACQLEDFADGDAAAEYRVGYVSSGVCGRSEHVHSQIPFPLQVCEPASRRAREGVAGLVTELPPLHPTNVQGLEVYHSVGILLQGSLPHSSQIFSHNPNYGIILGKFLIISGF